MSSYRDVLERSADRYRPEPDGFERLRRRRDRKRRNERIAAAIVALLIAVAATAGAVEILRSDGGRTPTEPTVTTVRIQDPTGDVVLSFPDTFTDVGFVDIVSAAVSEEGGTFTFALTLAHPIPPSFVLTEPYEGLGYEFCLDTDASSTPFGYPFAVSTSATCELIVDILARPGGHVSGTLIDRRTLTDGKDAMETPISVSITGTRVLTSIPSGSLGDPASLTWVLYTTELALPLGNDVFANVDEAPDSSAPAPWPAG
ncbi:MAG: hypothetical protein ACM3WR_06650 [Solirubrobacterales bacterium]|jgi:hypothetical protein